MKSNLEISEAQLEQILWDCDAKTLSAIGLDLPYYKKFRQLRIGGYGVCDMLYYSRHSNLPHPAHTITIVELKKGQINTGTFLQSVRYARGVQRFFFKKFKKWGKDGIEYGDLKVNIVLIGKEIDLHSDFCFIADWVNQNSIYSDSNRLYYYTYNFNPISGLRLKMEKGYVKENEGFK